MGKHLTLKVSSIIIATIGFILTIISIWLLLAALSQGCARQRGTIRTYPGGSSSGLYWEVKPATRTGSSRFYLGGLHHDSLRKDPTEFCEYLVDRWVASASIGIIVGLMQMILSGILVAAASGGALSRLPVKTTTIIWSVGNIFFVVAMVTAMAVGMDGHIHESAEVDIVGPFILVILALDIVLAFILAVTCAWVTLKKRTSHRDSYLYTRTPQQQQLQQKHTII